MTSDYLENRKQGEIQADINSSRSSILLPFSAGVGAIALGAAIYSTNLAKGGRLISNLIHFLGHPRGIGVTVDDAANIGKATPTAGTSGLRSLLTATVNFKTGNLNLGPIDLIDDLRSSLEIISKYPSDIATRIRQRHIEYINRKFANRTTSSYFTHDLNRVTIDQVLSDRDAWFNLIGKNQWEVLSKAKREGLVSGEHILDTKIFTAKSGVLRDLRLRNIFTKNIKVEGLLPDEIIYERVARFGMFGQERVAAGIIGESRGFAVLSPDKTFTGPRIFIGGKIYGFERTEAGEVVEHILASNRRLMRADSPLAAVSYAKEGQLELTPKKRTGFFGKLLTTFEEKTGVGRSFADRPSLLESVIINPVRRFLAISSGKGLIYRAPHKYANPFTRLTEDVAGVAFPEAIYRKGAVIPVAGGNKIVSPEELSFTEKLKVIFGISEEYHVIKKKAWDRVIGKGEPLNKMDLAVPRPDRGFKVPSGRSRFDYQLYDTYHNRINTLGIMKDTPYHKYMDVKKSRLGPFTSLTTAANYLIHRVASLASTSMLGISFAPAKTFLGNVARLGTIPLIYDALKETVSYADFLTKQLTGISPIEAIADVYAIARIGQQKLREAVGIQPAFNALEKHFPGSVDSEGAFFLRTLAPVPLAAALLGKGRAKTAGVLAGTLYAAIGGPEPGQSSEELEAEYAGTTKVPIRKGALWGLGYTPFFGGEVDYYDYSWYAKLKSDYRTKSLYGDKSEYFKYHANVLGIPFPTPHNLFGIRNLLNPYRFEEMHYYDRPYVQTGSPLEQFPIVGPALSATIGKILKPTITRQVDMPLYKAGLVQRGLDPETARMLGMSNIEASEPSYIDPQTPLNKLHKLAVVATEPLGIYKFVMEFMGVKLSSDKSGTIATSNIATDADRAFYDSKLGGMFGQTEFIRRFFLSDYNNTSYISTLINPIRNTMPDWMPGSGSMYERDRDYYLDFSMGDPYIKVSSGESRLPGAGYEALNQLHSGRAGVYDVVDRFLILADVAPYSQAYKTYAAQVQRMTLPPEWQKKVEEAFRYREESIGVDKRYLRYEDSLINLNQETKDSAIYRLLRKTYDFVTHDILAELPYVGSKLFPFRDPYEQYRKMYVEGSEFASWDRPWEGIIRPMIFDMASVNPAMAAVKGAGIGYLLSGPMRWFNPLKSIEQGSSLVGGSISTIIKGAGIGAGFSLGRIAMGESQDFIPAHIQMESDALSYMDSINYLKYRSLSEVAESQGKSKLAQQLNMLARRTIVGANNPILLRSVLPKSADKRFYDYFLALPEDRRTQVYEGVPDYMKYALATAWSRNYPSQQESEQMAVQSLPMIPSSDWIGWHPSVSIMGTKLSLIKHGINGVSDNYHRFGFYESQEAQLVDRIPTLYSDEVEFMTTPGAADFAGLLNIQNKNYMKSFGASDITIDSFHTHNRMNRKTSLFMDRSEDTKTAVRLYGR